MIVIRYITNNTLRVKAIKLKENWVQQCQDMDTMYDTWRVM